jgi:hypothetical protein
MRPSTTKKKKKTDEGITAEINEIENRKTIGKKIMKQKVVALRSIRHNVHKI